MRQLDEDGIYLCNDEDSSKTTSQVQHQIFLRTLQNSAINLSENTM
jgi:hypothetical protein